MAAPPLVAASTVPLLLSLLAAGESYGYALIQRVQLLSGGRLEWSEGTLYPVLHRLEREGWITSRWGQSPEGRKRKYYTLTAEGRRQSGRCREDWEAVDRALRSAWEAALA
ncbi:MAG: helix-turn-helix transcriptional regulator [Planctomycetota bacterium]